MADFWLSQQRKEENKADVGGAGWLSTSAANSWAVPVPPNEGTDSCLLCQSKDQLFQVFPQ